MGQIWILKPALESPRRGGPNESHFNCFRQSVQEEMAMKQGQKHQRERGRRTGREGQTRRRTGIEGQARGPEKNQ
eukprot:scaffold23992_cov41-Attheya_sp.AAC.1